jgi:hypothetical protein
LIGREGGREGGREEGACAGLAWGHEGGRGALCPVPCRLVSRRP